jgi:peptidoglycan/xylan/chitin deacetylase (PgdA/CDA1 family)
LIVFRLQPEDKKSEDVFPDSLQSYPVPDGFLVDSLRKSVQGKFKIQVSAAEGLVLTLMHNGNFIESVLPGEHEFSFEDVPLVNGENNFTIWGLSARGQSVLIDSFSVKYISPRLDYLLQPVYGVRTENKSVAFTFDGGSSNKGTKEILDILRDQEIKCTMFLTGRFVQNFPDHVRQILQDGHEIGNHSLTHPHFTNLEIDGLQTTRNNVNRAYLQKELQITDSLYYALTGDHMMPYWRAPFGETNREILFWAAELGFRHIGWSSKCDSWDWVEDKNSQLYRSAVEIKDYFLNMEEEKGLNGKIILMHLGSERTDDYAYQSLPGLIQELKNRGYQFKRVSQLLKE